MLTRRHLLNALATLPLGLVGKWKPAGESGYLATRHNTPRCEVYDANGTKWSNVRWVHTGTGEIEVCRLNVLGKKYCNADGTLAVSQFVIPSPVRLVPCDGGELPHSSYVGCNGSLAMFEEPNA